MEERMTQEMESRIAALQEVMDSRLARLSAGQTQMVDCMERLDSIIRNRNHHRGWNWRHDD